MTSKKTWLITGAGRGMGADIARAALAAGHNLVATGRNPDTVAEALSDSDSLLVVKLDVTNPRDAEAAVEAAVERFDGIDVLVNNAASFYARLLRGADPPEQMERQIATTPDRPDERHPRGPAGDAQAALRARRDDLLLGGLREL